MLEVGKGDMKESSSGPNKFVTWDDGEEE